MIEQTVRDTRVVTERRIVRAPQPGPRDSAPRRLAIDVRMATAPGIGTYLRNLLPRVVASRPSWLFTLLGARAVIDAEGWSGLSNVAVQEIDAPIYGVREQIALRRACGERFDAFWCPHYNIPLSVRGPLLVSVHDVIHLARPEYTDNAAKRWYARLMFGMVRRRATAILTCSEFTRQEFLRLVGPTRARFTVSPYGVDARWFQDPIPSSETPGHVMAVAKPYVVCVGSLKPHKNVGALISAFATLLDRIPHDLVVIGRAEGLRTADAEALSAASACGDRIRFAGEISDAALRSLVAGASALAHPSLYEGIWVPATRSDGGGRSLRRLARGVAAGSVWRCRPLLRCHQPERHRISAVSLVDRRSTENRSVEQRPRARDHLRVGSRGQRDARGPRLRPHSSCRAGAVDLVIERNVASRPQEKRPGAYAAPAAPASAEAASTTFCTVIPSS
jgi:glycosyltransferase involved in cell wall biosynthesis